MSKELSPPPIHRMAFQEYGLDDDVADIVSHFIGGTAVEIQVTLASLLIMKLVL